MPRRDDIDAIASAIAYRLGSSRSRSSPIAASLSSRSSLSRLSSAIAYRLSGGRGRGGSASQSGRSPESRLASAVAYRLRVARPTSPIAARLSSSRSAVGRRSVSTIASAVADRLASEGTLRQRSRVSIDALASAVTRRLRYSDQRGIMPVGAIASAVARRLNSSGLRRNSDALASSIATRLSRGRKTDLAANTETDPNAGNRG